MAQGSKTATRSTAATAKVALSADDARALHWFIRHLTFTDALASTPPHLGKEIRTERAYGIVRAVVRLQEAIEDAGHRGDAWMYGPQS